MERIVLEVKPGISSKWERASARLKRQVAEAVEQVLVSAEAEQRDIFEEKRHRTLNADDLRFYDDIRIDLSGYSFNRDEANER